MKYIDLHCDTMTELALRPERGTLLSNNCEIDISKLKKGGCFIQDFAIWYDQGGGDIQSMHKYVFSVNA